MSGGGMGAGGGAASGAMMGSVVPGIGTAIGAIAGGLMGALGGGLSGAQQSQAQKQAAMGTMMAANGNGAGIPHILQAASSLAPSSTPDFSAGGMDPSQWSFSMPDATPMMPPPPAPAPVAGQGSANTMTQNPNQIPSIPQAPAWQQALASTATTMDAIARNRPQQVQSGAGPHLFVPQGGRAPTIAAPIARAPSPIERYAMMLRR